MGWCFSLASARLCSVPERVLVQSVLHIRLVWDQFLRSEVVISGLNHVVAAEILSSMMFYFAKSRLFEVAVDESKVYGHIIKTWCTVSTKSQATLGVLSRVGLSIS